MKPAILTGLAIVCSGVTAVQQGRSGAGGPAVGQKAPDVKLTLLKDDKPFDLAGNFGARPTVLIFGSYT